MTRDERLARYRHLREINRDQQSSTVGCVARDTILDYGRRLGIAHGSKLVCGSMEEISLIFDLAVHCGKAGRSRAIDRYARSLRPSPEGDHAMMLHAAQAARFRLWCVERPHEIVGLRVTDLVSGEALWLIDEGLELSAGNGQGFAGRLMVVDDFVMTCGVVVPVDEFLLQDTLENMPNLAEHEVAGAVQDPRFAIGLYKTAIQSGVMEHTTYLDPEESEAELEGTA